MLINIPFEEVNNFCASILAKEWPYSMFAINFLKVCDDWRKKNKQLNVSLFYAKENIESGVFVGVLRSGTLQPAICIYALETYEDILETELTDLVAEWQGPISFEGFLNRHRLLVDRVIASKSLKIDYIYALKILSISVENALKLQISCPLDVEIAPLRAEHLDEMYEKWVMKKEYTIEELENSLNLENESALGVYCKSTGILLSRVMRAHNGAICALYTIEQARNKGYAKLLVKKVAKIIAERDVQPYSFTSDYNKTSLSVFHAAGYEFVCDLEKVFAK